MKRLEFIKKIGLATVGLPLLSSFEVFSFTKGYQQVIYPPVDDRFETFDFELFEKLKKLVLILSVRLPFIPIFHY